MSPNAAPLILTAALPPVLHRRFTALRSAHFPPERNYLEAHVTLFHALPPDTFEEVKSLVARLSQEFGPIGASVQGVMSLGNGTAIKLVSHGMLVLRDMIADRFSPLLTAQDQHSPRLHVTIQNKVSRGDAIALQASLSECVVLEEFAFPALEIFAYQGGPWEKKGRYPFRGRANPII